MRPNLATILTDSAHRDPDAVALSLGDAQLSYELLDHGAARVAGLLSEHGIGPGDRVAVMLPNVPYFALAYYGILRRGAVVVPVNVLLEGREVAYYLEDSGATLLIAWHGFEAAAREGAERAGAQVVMVEPGAFEGRLVEAPVLEEVADVDAEADTAVILYASGPTGRLAGARLSHADLHADCTAAADALADLSPQDVLLGALPLFHSLGHACGLNAAIYAGARLTLIARFDPAKALEVIERDAVTVFEGVPSMCDAMLHAPNVATADVGSLRVALCGGTPMPPQVRADFEAAFGCKVLEGRGRSEASPLAVVEGG